MAYVVLRLNGGSVNTDIQENIFDHLYAMGYFGIIALLFSRDKEKIEQERLSALRALGAALAHEMRTPLSTMSMMCKATVRRLHDDDFDKEKTLLGVKKMQAEVNEMMLAIDMILTRINAPQSADTIGKHGIKECVECMFERYPFGDNERDLVTFYCHNDFFFVGQKTAITHVLFNLMQNALYQIHSINKGNIVISTIRKRKHNVLFFKDTASGVNPEIYNKLFEPMVTGKAAGTGLGLHFCKTTMEAIGGEIICRSEEGKYTEFVLSFPPMEPVSC
ncbi:hypothetical protein FACS1894122_04770 [Alphaproteobacteria bacterium]|nr:hypothetical protein FACS1894122_04770 [Alphaproteobacteria bacterium]